MKCIYVLLSKAIIVLGMLVLSIAAPAQTLQKLEPATGHYKTLASLSAKPNALNAALDTVLFPWSEYSDFALASTLMRTVYLSKEEEALLPVLINFPANSSEQTRAELNYLLSLQAKRTPAEMKRADSIGKIGTWPTLLNPKDSAYESNLAQLFYIGSPVGPWFKHRNFPVTTQLLLNCIQDIRVTEFRLKMHFRRARPYHIEPKLQPMARMSSPAFASGHTLWAFTQAFIFSEIIPERRAAFIQMAEEVRWSRELMGIHYPSDNEASRIIAWQLLHSWFKNPQFVADLNKAKDEWNSKRTAFANE